MYWNHSGTIEILFFLSLGQGTELPNSSNTLKCNRYVIPFRYGEKSLCLWLCGPPANLFLLLWRSHETMTWEVSNKWCCSMFCTISNTIFLNIPIPMNSWWYMLWHCASRKNAILNFSYRANSRCNTWDAPHHLSGHLQLLHHICRLHSGPLCPSGSVVIRVAMISYIFMDS